MSEQDSTTPDPEVVSLNSPVSSRVSSRNERFVHTQTSKQKKGRRKRRVYRRTNRNGPQRRDARGGGVGEVGAGGLTQGRVGGNKDVVAV